MNTIKGFNIQDYISEYKQSDGTTIRVLVDYIDDKYFKHAPVMYLVGEDWMAHCSGCAEKKILQVQTAMVNWASGPICQECGKTLPSFQDGLSPRF